MYAISVGQYKHTGLTTLIRTFGHLLNYILEQPRLGAERKKETSRWRLDLRA